MPAELIINVRQGNGTYIARAKGFKQSASCTAGAAQAAQALLCKLNLKTNLLQEQPNTGLGYGCSLFTHPGFQPEAGDD